MSNINQLVYEVTVGEKTNQIFNSIKNYNLPKSFDEPKKTLHERFKQWGNEATANPSDHPGRVAAILGVPAALTAGAGYAGYKTYKYFKNRKNEK